jgi:methionine synthase / methylenetetrahydrofolate reductase(NADPH)
MKIEDFEKRLESSVLVADGAMGSMLFEAAGLGRCFEELNVLQAEAVFAVHQLRLIIAA